GAFPSKGEAGTLPPGDTTGLVSAISPAKERRQRYLLDLMWASLDGDYEFSDFELSLLRSPKSDTTVPSSMAEPTPVAESAPAASSSVVGSDAGHRICHCGAFVYGGAYAGRRICPCGFFVSGGSDAGHRICR
ncbi:hypothetical protein THAOC_26340, partial [Thalassiosira oceanica]